MASLAEMDADGRFAFHIYGNRFTGKMVLVPDRKTVNRGKVYEMVLNDRHDLPEHVRAE